MTLDSRLVNLAAVARKLVEDGLAAADVGSTSLRWQDQCYLSPTGLRLDRLSAGDFIPLAINGANTWQLARTTADYAVHLACYRARADALTVLQIQPLHCLALGCAGLDLPALTPEFYRTVGSAVPLLAYEAPGTPALAHAVGEAIAAHRAVLLRQRGLVVTASSSEEALAHTRRIEDAARAVLLAHAATGSCSALTAEQMQALS